MSIGIALTAVSAVLGVASQLEQRKAQKEAEEEREQARRVEEARARRENQRRRRQQLRQQRAAQAEISTRGANQGVLQSSGVQGGLMSAQSQAQSNISDININEGFTLARNSFLDNAAEIESDAAQFGANMGMFQSALGLGASLNKEYQSSKAAEPTPTNNQFLKDNPSYASVIRG